MTIFLALLLVVTVAYAVAMLTFAFGLWRLRAQKVNVPDSWPSVSVVVPARNEAEVVERTLESVLAQDYPGSWEVIVVDDRSTDDTPVVLAALAARYARLKVLTVTEPFPKSPKKNALDFGIRSSSAALIVTTDADCIYQSEWLTSLVQHFDSKTGVVAGLTVFDLPAQAAIPVWQRIQWLDFFVQNFIAAASVGLGIPSSCNGSNLAYRRDIYQHIEGFGSTGNIVSGDDVLFAQRVAKLTQWKMAFSIDSRSTVRSLPVHSLGELVQQRLRWASKGLTYRRSMLLFLFAIYVFYLSLIVAGMAALMDPLLLTTVGTLFGLKTVADFILIRTACVQFGQQHLLKFFLPFELLHTVATPLIGLGGLLLPYRWKGDWYRSSKLPQVIRRRLAIRKRKAALQQAAAQRTS